MTTICLIDGRTFQGSSTKKEIIDGIEHTQLYNASTLVCNIPSSTIRIIKVR
jgi:hypothetical protein